MYLCYRFIHPQQDAKMKKLYELLAARELHYAMKSTFCIILHTNELTYFLTDSSAMHDEFHAWMEREKLEATLVQAPGLHALSSGDADATGWYGSEIIYAQLQTV